MSNIEWTDATWNPVVGCTPVSPGCLNCYAATMARRQEAIGTPGYGPRSEVTRVDGLGQAEARRIIRIAEVKGGRAVFTGEVRCLPDRLEEPLHWRKPRRVFVNSMSDLFHEAVPFEFIDRVFAVMALCPQHEFQVLTKRPERMAEYMTRRYMPGYICDCAVNTFKKYLHTGEWKEHADGTYRKITPMPWPLPNVWLGTSCEDQARLDERVPHLLKCPARVRFLSLEPLLGPLDLSAFFGGPYVGLPGDKVHSNWNAGIDWVIVGGESGPKARTCNVAWIRSVVEQCKAAGVPCFVKQLGANPQGDPPTPPVRNETTKTTTYTVQEVFEIRDRKAARLARATVSVSYYAHERLKRLYSPSEGWVHHDLSRNKASAQTSEGAGGSKSPEVLIVRRGA